MNRRLTPLPACTAQNITYIRFDNTAACISLRETRGCINILQKHDAIGQEINKQEQA